MQQYKTGDSPRAPLQPAAQQPAIPGYRLIHQLASSPHAAVYLAYSEELNQQVAVKILRNQEPQRLAERTQRFLRERELLMRVRHPSIVDIYDWGHWQDLHFLVTEYFPAGSLELRIRNLMTVRDSVDVFVQIAGALVTLHQAGLCHRDLKPANVMMRADGSLVLIDFGLASTSDCDSLTNAGEVHGSPYYVSPEQVDGSSSGDLRSDLYSLGIMFYEMLTGHRPFQGKTIMDIIHAHKTAAVPTLPTALSHFQPLIHQLLAKQPAQRPASASDALAALARLRV